MSDTQSKNSVIPLKRVALYKHGIGYFERRGSLKGPGEVELMCGPDEIDDMLKSLLVLRDGGKQISAITYESSKTLETRLSEFGFDLRNCEGMIELIVQLKGAPVTVDFSGESIMGRVIGLDKTEQVVGERKVTEHQLVLYTDSKNLRRIALSSIRHLCVNDPSLSEEIQQQLELLFQATRKKDQKLLKVHVNDEEERDLMIVYAIPCPIWKTSYRLVWTEDERLILQGSAIVDNTQEEDWTDVEMTLVSASPISFIQPLYDPVQPMRQTIDAQGIRSTNPFVAERAHQKLAKTKVAGAPAPMLSAMAAPMAAPAQAQTGSWGAGAAGAAYGAAANMPRGGAMDMLMAQNLGMAEEALGVSTQQSGETFQYNIEAPVTVPRNSSALINIVQQVIEGERISLYNETRNASHPFAAIRLKNNTKLTLEAGPVTVLEASAYAGEALLDVVKPDDTRFVAYASDLGVHVICRIEQSRKPVWRVRCWRGYLYFDYKEQYKKIYNIENLSDKKKVVYVEHPVTTNRKYVGDDKPAEVTEHFYRFRKEVDGKTSDAVDVLEETETFTNVWLENFDTADLSELTWALRQNFVDNSFKAFLGEVMKRREEIILMRNKEQQLRELIAQFTNDQERARENIKAVGSSADRYKRAIDDAEDAIMKTTAELNSLVATLNDKRAAFSNFVAAQLIADIDETVAVAAVT